jgi:hypothetical protein
MTIANLPNRGHRRGWQAMEIKRQEKRGSQPDNRGFSVGYDRLNRAILPVGAISPPHIRISLTYYSTMQHQARKNTIFSTARFFGTNLIG